ncbi:hypothetical protein [Vibrio breoganii]|uniref:hypothetical protein n=1 Tax=Vibrio breoganii TaxID=553239 RepID=UPI00030F217E|nr:hypothetical protein [Vibrio breoganii]
MDEEKKYKITVELTPERMGKLIRYADKTGRTYTDILSDVIADMDFTIEEGNV